MGTLGPSPVDNTNNKIRTKSSFKGHYELNKIWWSCNVISGVPSDNKHTKKHHQTRTLALWLSFSTCISIFNNRSSLLDIQISTKLSSFLWWGVDKGSLHYIIAKWRVSVEWKHTLEDCSTYETQEYKNRKLFPPEKWYGNGIYFQKAPFILTTQFKPQIWPVLLVIEVYRFYDSLLQFNWKHSLSHI